MKYRITPEASVIGRVEDNIYLAVLGCVAAGMEDEEKIAEKLGTDKSTAYSAIAFWKGAGILGIDAKEEKTEGAPQILPSSKSERGIPSYTSSELARHIDENKEIASLLHYCSKRTERILSPAETGDIVYLVDSVGLTPSMVMTLVNYFADRGKRGIRYIAKSAISHIRRGSDGRCASQRVYPQKDGVRQRRDLLQNAHRCRRTHSHKERESVCRKMARRRKDGQGTHKGSLRTHRRKNRKAVG